MSIKLAIFTSVMVVLSAGLAAGVVVYEISEQPCCADYGLHECCPESVKDQCCPNETGGTS